VVSPITNLPLGDSFYNPFMVFATGKKQHVEFTPWTSLGPLTSCSWMQKKSNGDMKKAVGI